MGWSMVRSGGNGSWAVGTGTLIVAAVLGMAGAACSQTEAVPSEWSEIGTVAEWRAADARFYRHRASQAHLDRSRDHLDQQAIYAETRIYRGRYDGVALANWLEMDDQERAERREAARSELKFVTDFRNRILNEVQNTRSGNSVAWGTRISDHTIIGDMLGRLRTAVSLAPDNPYAWHLYSYFASVAGDEFRALQACDGAQAALDALPDDALPEMRAAVALDRGWLLRAQGEYVAARTALEAAAAHGANGDDVRLLQGLLAAQSGDDATAIAVAAELRAAPVGAFPVDFRSADYVPELSNVESWTRKSSTYLHDWIMAWTWLRAGRADMARAVFGAYNLDDNRPFADRFWNEAGAIYAATGRPGMATAAWNQALICIPYQPYLISKGHVTNLSQLTGQPGSVPYELAFDSNIVAGSRLAWAADLVAAVADTYDEHERQRLASRALDQLEICRRVGLFAGQAAVLQGQVYHLMGDTQSALVEVTAALQLLDEAGDQAGMAAVLSGLSKRREELAPQDIARFYGQSGASRGRWAAETAPDATRAGLQAAYEADPGAANRRALARFLVRNGEPAAGRHLALVPLAGQDPDAGNVTRLAASDLTLVLEADRVAGDTALAEAMVATLADGGEDPWSDAGVWALAGFICVDQGLQAEGKTALERASALDPGNHGLKIQLSLM